MRILVIGGTNFIGPFVVKQLVERGCKVDVFHRGIHNAILPPEVHEIRSELAGIPVTKFPVEIGTTKYDAIIHMVAMGQVDAEAAAAFFGTKTGRLVAISSGDVYRAYGIFSRLETGAVEPVPLTEHSSLRSKLFPYRKNAKSETDLEYWYEKILMERAILKLGEKSRVLRLPKVYGAGNNRDFATVHRYRNHPDWRWTHGYVENVAAAIVIAALHPSTTNQIFNVGEEVTPSVGERLKHLPASSVPPEPDTGYDFRQQLVYDTARIRTELGYREIVVYEEGIRRTVTAT